MGGTGSTRWSGHRKRPLVEEALAIDLAPIQRAGLFRMPGGTVARLEWTAGGTALGTASVEVWSHPAGGDYMCLRLEATSSDHGPKPAALEVVERARRKVFICPCCEQGTRKIYIDRADNRIACRRCLGLQYRSAQQHDARVDQARRDPRGFVDGRERLSSLRSRFVTTRIAHRALAAMAAPQRGRGWGSKSMKNWERVVARVTRLSPMSDMDSLDGRFHGMRLKV